MRSVKIFKSNIGLRLFDFLSFEYSRISFFRIPLWIWPVGKKEISKVNKDYMLFGLLLSSKWGNAYEFHLFILFMKFEIYIPRKSKYIEKDDPNEPWNWNKGD